MGWDAPWHWIVLALIVIALFGYKKLPEASRALGRSLRIFKTEIKGMGEDDRTREAAKAVEAAPAPAVDPTAPSTGAVPNGTAGSTNGVAPAAPAAAATSPEAARPDAVRPESVQPESARSGE